MVSVSSVLMAPVRGVVWLVKLPFVLIWALLRYIGSLLYRAVAAVLSVPAYYLGRVGARLKLAWIWTKTSASKIRLCFPYTSNYPEHSGTYKALPPPEHDYDPYYLYAGRPQYHRGGGGEGATSRRRSRHGSSNRRNRKAIAAALAQLLLEPLSPSDSDEDGKPLLSTTGSQQPEEVEERTKLIMDLLKISKTDGDAQITELSPQELQTLRERARNKEQLESLIAEMEQTDPSLMLTKKQQKSSKTKKTSQRHRSLRQTVDDSDIANDHRQTDYDRKEEGESNEEEEGEGGEGEEGEEVEPLFAAHRHKFTGDLSPVQESPEYKPEEMNYKELEKDLNLALSKLNSEISELQVDEEVKEESIESQITHIVTVSNPQHQPTPSQGQGEEFPSVPRVNPSLGIKAGHDRRAVAAARKSRPPSRKNASSNQQGAPSQVFRDKQWQADKQDYLVSDDSWDEDSDFSDEDGSDGEIGDVPGRYRRKRHESLNLSDQLSLLSPTSSRSPSEVSIEKVVEVNTAPPLPPPITDDDISSLYAKVDKTKKKKKSEGVKSGKERPRTGSDPTPATNQAILTSRGSTHSMQSEYGERESAQVLAGSQPPWIQMRVRKSSDGGTQSATTTAPASTQPPWMQMRSNKNNSGHSSLPSTPTATNQPSHDILPHPQPAPQPSSQSTTVFTDSNGRVLPPKPSIPRPDPPSTAASSVAQPSSSSEEEESAENDSSSDGKQDENLYDTLKPLSKEPQKESRIFPLAETPLKQAERPKYLHELLSDNQKEDKSGFSRSRRAGSLRITESASPALPTRNPASKLKRTSSADTVSKAGKKDGGKTKERHSSSSSRERRDSEARGRSDKTDSRRKRSSSSSGDRTPSLTRRRSSEKRGSTSSSKGSPSPKESTSAFGTVWKLLATPTSSRRRHGSSSKESSSPSPKKSGEREVKRRKSSSSKSDVSPGSKE